MPVALTYLFHTLTLSFQATCHNPTIFQCSRFPPLAIPLPVPQTYVFLPLAFPLPFPFPQTDVFLSLSNPASRPSDIRLPVPLQSRFPSLRHTSSCLLAIPLPVPQTYFFLSLKNTVSRPSDILLHVS